jgi:hypothetical protein
MRDDIWLERGGRDAYTQKPRAFIREDEQNVDHVLEVQLVEHAALDLLSTNRELVSRFRDAVNTCANLNVTARKVNQAKRGPFTAALNRLRKFDGGLREVSVEQLARTGRARWLVDEGIWANIEKQTVVSYDKLAANLNDARLTRAQTAIMEHAVDNLHRTLEKIQIM